MKRFSLFLLLIALFLLVSCGNTDTDRDASELSESVEEGESTSENGRFPETVDFDLPLFVLDGASDGDTRVLVVSDNHFRSFDGVGDYSDDERQKKLIDTLIAEYQKGDIDCILFNGDMINNNEYLKTLKKNVFTAEDATREFDIFYNTYLLRLDEAGIPYFCLNASHDSLLPPEFEEVFGYPDNYAVMVGSTVFVCCNTYAGARGETRETTESDVPESFSVAVTKLLAHDCVKNAFVVCHWPSDYANLRSIIENPKVIAAVAGHSHYNEVGSFCGKPLLQTGHFSRAYTKMLTWGLGFSPFCPVNAQSAEMTTDEDGNLHRDFRATGSPWQYRVVETSTNSDGKTFIESYMIFPEICYGAFSSDGNGFSAFTQEYTEARPSFLGETSPVDKSYFATTVGK